MSRFDFCPSAIVRAPGPVSHIQTKNVCKIPLLFMRVQTGLAEMITDPGAIVQASRTFAMATPAAAADKDAPPAMTTTSMPTTIPVSIVSARLSAAEAIDDPSAAFEAFIRQQARRASSVLMAGRTTNTRTQNQAQAALDIGLAAAVKATTDLAAYAARKGIFAANLNKIAALNEYAAASSPTGYPTIAFGITPFAHLTTEEFVRNYLGHATELETDDAPDSRLQAGDELSIARRARGRRGRNKQQRQKQQRLAKMQGEREDPRRQDRPRRRDLMASVGGFPLTCAPSSSQTTEVPYPFVGASYNAEAFDWRNVDGGGKNLVTDVRDQNSPMPCRAFETFAAVGAIETAMLKRYPQLDRNTLDLSEQDMNDCWYNNQCEVASYLEVFFDRVTCQGVAWEGQVPYRATDVLGTSNCKSTLARYDTGVRAWAYVNGTEETMAQALNYSPIANELRVNPWMIQLYTAGVFDCRYARPPVFPQPGNDTDIALYFAATTLIAYRNSVVVTPVNMSDQVRWNVWTGKMSLGPGWGDKGYIHLRKDCSGDASLGALAMYNSRANYRVIPISEGQSGAPPPSSSPSPLLPPSSPSPVVSPSPSGPPAVPSPSPSPPLPPAPSPSPPLPSPSPSPPSSSSPSPSPPSPPPTNALICKSVTKTLQPSYTGCDGVTIDTTALWEAPLAADVTVPSATRQYGPGKHLVNIVPVSPPGIASCVATVTVLPCPPACVSKKVIYAPLGTCAAATWPSGLLDKQSVSQWVTAATTTAFPLPPFRVGMRSASFTLTYSGGVSVTSPPCDFQVVDSQFPVVQAPDRCIQPLNGVNAFASRAYCFTVSQLAQGTDNCGSVSYRVMTCRNIRPLLPMTIRDPCFFGPTLACVNLDNAPPPADLSPRTLEARITAADTSGNRVTIATVITIHYKPVVEPGQACVSV